MRGACRRFALAAGASAALSLSFASSSSASLTTSLVDDELRLSSTVPNEVNRVVAEFGPDGLAFADLQAGVSAGVCPVNGSAIVCGNVLNNVERFRFDLRGGRDQLSMVDPRLLFLPGVRVFTGTGDDRVFTPFTQLRLLSLGPGDDIGQASLLADTVHGGTGGDHLEPGPGDDIVRGDAGNDVVRGGWRGDLARAFGRSDGRDKLFGDQGKDQVLAKDFTKDKRIDCGDGQDVLRRDSFDPAGRHCE